MVTLVLHLIMEYSIVSPNFANYFFSQGIIYFDNEVYHIVFICVHFFFGGNDLFTVSMLCFNILISVALLDQTENKISKVKKDVLKNRNHK